MMADPIAKQLDDKWAGPFLNEPDISKVRSWLSDQSETDIKLYLGTFEEDLDERHRTRAALIREELERRAKPPPDRVKEINAWLRSKWSVAAVVLLVGLVGGAAAFHENLCKIGICLSSVVEQPALSVDQVQLFEEAVSKFVLAVNPTSPEGN